MLNPDGVAELSARRCRGEGVRSLDRAVGVSHEMIRQAVEHDDVHRGHPRRGGSVCRAAVFGDGTELGELVIWYLVKPGSVTVFI
jgi:hypothetical protein